MPVLALLVLDRPICIKDGGRCPLALLPTLPAVAFITDARREAGRCEAALALPGASAAPTLLDMDMDACRLGPGSFLSRF